MKKEKLLELICKKFNLPEKEAAGLILRGDVLVDEKPTDKTGALVDPSAKIRIRQKNKYVSRGAYKLLTAFNNFNISVAGKTCLDIGSSTGGFTQVLLEKGASRVYAADCGKNLLHFTLRLDCRIVSLENKKYSDISLDDFKEKIDFAVSDISFTSSVKLIEFLCKNLNINEMVVLIKPQFEYERLKQKLSLSGNFNGIIKDDFERNKIIDEIIDEIRLIGMNIVSYIKSDIKGAKGNIEYLFYLTS